MSYIIKLIIIIVLIGELSAESANNNLLPSGRRKSCRALVAEITQQQMSSFNDCASTLGYTTITDKLEKSTCIFKCVMQSVGVVRADGRLNEPGLYRYFDQHFPNPLNERARNLAASCLRLIRPSSGAVAVDPFCKSHQEFVKCMTRSYLKLCQQG